MNIDAIFHALWAAWNGLQCPQCKGPMVYVTGFIPLHPKTLVPCPEAESHYENIIGNVLQERNNRMECRSCKHVFHVRSTKVVRNNFLRV